MHRLPGEPRAESDDVDLLDAERGRQGGRRGDGNTNFVANGARNSTSDVLLDGVSVVTVEQNSGIADLRYAPAVDAGRPSKIQPDFFSAEYGQTGGARINVVTRSGTNGFQRTASGFLRHSDPNGNNWFSIRAGRARPCYRRDQLGSALGGPVVRNKTFFTTYVHTRPADGGSCFQGESKIIPKLALNSGLRLELDVPRL